MALYSVLVFSFFQPSLLALDGGTASLSSSAARIDTRWFFVERIANERTNCLAARPACLPVSSSCLCLPILARCRVVAYHT